jgi:signal peptidase II
MTAASSAEPAIGRIVATDGTDHLGADQGDGARGADRVDRVSDADRHGGERRGSSAGRTRGGRRIAIARASVAVAAVVLVLDQITKNWALENLENASPRHVIGTLQWNLAFNSGMAFSRGRGLGPFIGVLAFVVVIGLVVSSARVETRLGRLAAGLLIGGALGNLLDRAFRGDGLLNGAVIDFIDLQWWPIFNIADVGVTVGAVLFMIASLLAPRPLRR